MSFENIIVNEGNASTGPKLEVVYLSAKRDFPMNKPKNFVIKSANPSRSLFKGKSPFCMSFDGETGKRPSEEWKEEHVCRECVYLKGVDDLKCAYKCQLHLEHEDPESEYQIGIGFGAQKMLSQYVLDLQKDGLSPDMVETEITRVENPEGPGGIYLFNKVRELDLNLTAAEEDAKQALLKKAGSVDEPITTELAAMTLMNMEALVGISESRATRIAESMSVDGVITP